MEDMERSQIFDKHFWLTESDIRDLNNQSDTYFDSKSKFYLDYIETKGI